MIVVDFVDLILEVHEFLQFLFEILQLGVFGVKSFETFIDFLLPQPVVLLERVEEFLDIVLCALDGASKQ